MTPPPKVKTPPPVLALHWLECHICGRPATHWVDSRVTLPCGCGARNPHDLKAAKEAARVSQVVNGYRRQQPPTQRDRVTEAVIIDLLDALDKLVAAP